MDSSECSALTKIFKRYGVILPNTTFLIVFLTIVQCVTSVSSAFATGKMPNAAGIIEEGASNPIEVGLPQLLRFSPKVYGAEPQIFAIAQDKRGVIYASNNDGILEYDGARWRLIRAANNQQVFSLALDDNGRVYVGGTGEIGYLQPDANGQMQYVSLLGLVPFDQRDFSVVWSTYVTPDGVVFSSYKRLFRLQGENLESWQSTNTFHRTFWVNNRVLVFEIGRGLLELQDGRLSLLPGGERFASELISAVISVKSSSVTESDHILVGTRTQGFFISDGNSFIPWITDIDTDVKRDLLYCAIQLSDGRFAVGTLQGGLYFINQQGRKVGHLTKANGLTDDTIVSLLTDREKGLWLGTGNGLSRAETDSALSRFNDKNGLLGTIYAVHRHQGQLYVGTSQGLFRLQVATPAHFIHIAGVNSQTWALLSVGDQLLVGNLQGVYSVKDDNATLIKSTEHAMSLLASKVRPGLVFLGTRNGLAVLRWHGGNWLDEGFLPGVVDEIRTLFEREDGGLWLGSRHNGLFRVNAPAARDLPLKVEHYGVASGLPGLKNNWVYNVNGVPLFATEQGVYRFVEASQRFAPDPDFAKMFSTPQKVSSLIADNKGDIWMYAKDPNTGLEVAGLAAKNDANAAYSWNTLGLQALRGPTISGMDHIHQDDDGTVWFAAADGLFRFEQNSIKQDEPPFAALVRRVSGRNGQLFFAGGGIAATLTLDYVDNSLRFEFAAPSFDGLDGLQFQVRLDGIESDWSDWSAENYKDYNNLFEGSYRFQVRAKNRYGTISDEAEYVFTLLPPWYRTVWAYLAYLFILSCAIWMVLRWRLSRLKAQKRVLEATVAERTAELKLANRQLEELSTTDQLTGLRNRRFLADNLDKDIAQIHRLSLSKHDGDKLSYTDDADLIFFLVDLDHFKQVNDIHGHTAGDAVLIQIKKILEKIFRETDYLVRWGGEEFLAIARFSNRANAPMLAERLRQAVEHHDFDIGDGKILKKTCSIGFACYPFVKHEPSLMEWSKVIDVADYCLYAAKQSSRNAWVGLDSTADCMKVDLFNRLLAQTNNLIQSKELKLFTSISEREKLIW